MGGKGVVRGVWNAVIGLLVGEFLGGGDGRGDGDGDGKERERWGMKKVLDIDLGKR